MNQQTENNCELLLQPCPREGRDANCELSSQRDDSDCELSLQRSLRPALFFDRDGTLMKEVDHCHHPEKVQAIEGALSALKKTHEQGWYNVIITNQSGIGRGYFTENEFEAVQQELQRQLEGLIDASYMSPDLPNTNSLRRKPAPGMLLEAAAELGIDLSASFMIGDRASDIDAGKAAGCRTILVLTGYGEEHRDCGADFIVNTVVDAIEISLAAQQKGKK
jgi:D-glycero-D-manno-heptose 1,7-bisphosphate phosphatase